MFALVAAVAAAACADDESAGAGGDAPGTAASTTGGASISAAGSTASQGTGGDAGAGQGGASSSGTGPGGGGAGGAGDGGAGGAGGAAPDQLVGWASVPGLGVETTIGGLGGDVVTATTAAELLDYAERDEPLVIQIEGTIEAPRVEVASNKTLIGLGDDALLRGGLSVSGGPGDYVSNIIIKNLAIDATTSDAIGDGINVRYAHHVWIDHCAIWDAPDGNLDITRASDFVTVSWTRFWYSDSPPDDGHRFSNLIGGSDDSADEDEDALNVTFHHVWWGARVQERMPRVRFGDVHVFNSYFHTPGNNYGVQAALRSRVLVENNHFHEVEDPHQVRDGEGGELVAIGNLYEDTVGDRDEAGAAFEPPYEYVLDPADQVRALVEAGAGPRP